MWVWKLFEIGVWIFIFFLTISEIEKYIEEAYFTGTEIKSCQGDVPCEATIIWHSLKSTA